MKKAWTLFAALTFAAAIGCGESVDPGTGEEPEKAATDVDSMLEDAGMSEEDYAKALAEEQKNAGN